MPKPSNTTLRRIKSAIRSGQLVKDLARAYGYPYCELSRWLKADERKERDEPNP